MNQVLCKSLPIGHHCCDDGNIAQFHRVDVDTKGLHHFNRFVYSECRSNLFSDRRIE